MPLVNEYKCNKCGFTLPEGWGVLLYVLDDNGESIICRHPDEKRDVEKVLGEAASLDTIRERTGFISFCVCLDCLHQFKADFGESGWSPYEDDIAEIKPRFLHAKDVRDCPKCNSENVKTELELVGEACPKCKEGIIEETRTEAIS